MYFVDRNQIEDTLVFMEKILQEIKKQSFTSFPEKMGLERMVHVLIESILDTGNMMIDGFIMRDPGSYDDIIDILVDEKVLPQEEEKAYKDFIGLRKMLVNDYRKVNHDDVSKTLNGTIDVLENFSSNIRTYLANELGVAHAFSNNE